MSSNLGFEIEGRRLKVEKYVTELDKYLKAHDIDPLDAGVADGLAAWDRKAWLRFARHADLNAPGTDGKTVAAILEAYRTRAAKERAA